MTNNLQGKVALVTGGGSGIGQATAVAFARAGASVVVSGRQPEKLQATLALIAEIGGRGVSVQADVSRAEDVERMVVEGVKAFGRIDCAFNNAGVLGTMGPLAELDEQSFDEVMAVNVKGVWLCMKYEINQMLRQGGGVIVNNASLSAMLATPGGAFYNASKHAVLGLTKCAAVEYIRSGIRVNAVCPGSFPTAMLEKFLAFGAEEENQVEARRAMFLSGIPAGRFGMGSEIANVVVWLCSEASSFVVGQSIVVDGGAIVM